MSEMNKYEKMSDFELNLQIEVLMREKKSLEKTHEVSQEALGGHKALSRLNAWAERHPSMAKVIVGDRIMNALNRAESKAHEKTLDAVTKSAERLDTVHDQLKEILKVKWDRDVEESGLTPEAYEQRMAQSAFFMNDEDEIVKDGLILPNGMELKNTENIDMITLYTHVHPDKLNLDCRQATERELHETLVSNGAMYWDQSGITFDRAFDMSEKQQEMLSAIADHVSPDIGDRFDRQSEFLRNKRSLKNPEIDFRFNVTDFNNVAGGVDTQTLYINPAWAGIENSKHKDLAADIANTMNSIDRSQDRKHQPIDIMQQRPEVKQAHETYDKQAEALNYFFNLDGKHPDKEEVFKQKLAKMPKWELKMHAKELSKPYERSELRVRATQREIAKYERMKENTCKFWKITPEQFDNCLVGKICADKLRNLNATLERRENEMKQHEDKLKPFLQEEYDRGLRNSGMEKIDYITQRLTKQIAISKIKSGNILTSQHVILPNDRTIKIPELDRDTARDINRCMDPSKTNELDRGSALKQLIDMGAISYGKNAAVISSKHELTGHQLASLRDYIDKQKNMHEKITGFGPYKFQLGIRNEKGKVETFDYKFTKEMTVEDVMKDIKSITAKEQQEQTQGKTHRKRDDLEK